MTQCYSECGPVWESKVSLNYWDFNVVFKIRWFHNLFIENNTAESCVYKFIVEKMDSLYFLCFTVQTKRYDKLTLICKWVLLVDMKMHIASYEMYVRDDGDSKLPFYEIEIDLIGEGFRFLFSIKSDLLLSDCMWNYKACVWTTDK